jgi:predicted methyltransferase
MKKFLDRRTMKHPAKMAAGLLSRIFDHLIATGLLSPGTTIVDFMAGTGRTAVEATRRGYRAVTVELEPKFVEFQKLNKAVMEKTLKREVHWTIYKGDARKLSTILSGGAGIVSPPYAGGLGHDSARAGEKWEREKHIYNGDGERSYNSDAEKRNPAQIGNLKAGVVSPPYVGGLGEGSAPSGEKWAREKNIYNGNGERSYRSDVKERNPAQIGNLRAGVVSPPYAEMKVVSGHNVPSGGAHRIDSGDNGVRSGYSPDPNNIGNLKAGVISPPYGTTVSPRSGGKDRRSDFIEGGVLTTKEGYGKNVENIGNLREGSAAAIVSPPYGMGNGIGHGGDSVAFKRLLAEKGLTVSYTEGRDKTNIGNLPEGSASTPSPYMEAPTGINEATGPTKGRLVEEKQETYWDAMRTVYTEAYQSGISPLVIVTKDPTRDRQIVPLGASTAALIEQIGYRIVDYHRAVLFLESAVKTFDGKRSRLKVKTRKEIRKHRQFTLIGRGSRKGIRKEEEVQVVTERRVVDTDAPGGVAKLAKGRVSFFKLLSIRNGLPAARWEDIIIAVIPDGQPKSHTTSTSVTSHPYQQVVIDKLEPKGDLHD